jgi:hypothetical protein
VVKALTASRDDSSFQRPRLAMDECSQLRRLGLWTGDRIAPDAYRRVGRRLHKALVADSKGRAALQIVRDYAAEQGIPIALVLRFPLRQSN